MLIECFIDSSIYFNFFTCYCFFAGDVIYGSHSMDHHPTLTQDHSVVTSISEGTLHDGQLLLGDAVSAAAALVGVQDQNTGVVSIPMHAAAAMMQIQGLFLFLLSLTFLMLGKFS